MCNKNFLFNQNLFLVLTYKRVVNKEDLTNLLPSLSTYLGHVDLQGTQHYLGLTADLYPQIIDTVEQEFSFLILEVPCYETVLLLHKLYC